MKKNKVFNLGIGTTSILMTFIVVSLTVLAILSYMVTNKDKKITDKKAEYVAMYQKADCNAVEKVAQIDDKLCEINKKKLKLDSKKAKKILEEIENIAIDYKGNKISYNVDVGSNAYIQVELGINVKNKKVKKEDRIDIIRWQLVNKGHEIEEENLNVWGN